MNEELAKKIQETLLSGNQTEPDQLKSSPSEANTTLTRGQKSVGLTFNPSGDPNVNKAKQLCADLIDLLHESHGLKPFPSWETNVFRTEAFNKIIAAQMAIVKFITYKD